MRKIVFFLIALLTFITSAPLKDNVDMIAHRGYSGRHPDNTEEAFLAAAEHGSDGCETDIRMTADGVLVCSHNDYVKYNDGSVLYISESTFEDLTQKPLKNTRSFTDAYLCSFERYLEISKEHNLICYIEAKGDFTDDMIIKIFTLAEEVYDLKMCEFQSFEFENLIRAHELFPDLKIMLTYGGEETGYERCFEYGFDIDADYNVITKEMVEQFHSRGLRVGAWTCNTFSSVYYAYSLGVDSIESDWY